MPELPEVQCFANDLNTKYAGRKIRAVHFHRAGIREPFRKSELLSVLKRATIRDFSRIGKRLVLNTNLGRIAISLGMTGRFVDSVASKPQLHEHISLVLENGLVLGFVDARRFGSWRKLSSEFVDHAVDGLDVIGLGNLFASETAANAKRPIKSLLMDQNVIGGVGNIYAVEALFRIGVRPTRLCCKVKTSEWAALAKILPQILEEAIQKGGSSVASYRRLSGDEGGFQDAHLVYGRDGEKCLKPRCSGVVRRVVQSGRSSWFCPLCQK